MTAVNFPDSPSVNQTFTVGERTWKWTGTTWDIVASIEVTGPQGPQGEPGAGLEAGGDAGQVLAKASGTNYDTEWVNLPTISYTHGQTATSATWEIVHNLGFYPSVTVKDNYGNLIEGYVSYTSNSSLTIEFSSAFSGYAYLS